MATASRRVVVRQRRTVTAAALAASLVAAARNRMGAGVTPAPIRDRWGGGLVGPAVYPTCQRRRPTVSW